MKVQAIYKKLGTPPNLQEHMLRVASVGSYIFSHWQGPSLNLAFLHSTLLLHDIGNIVKFDLKKHPEFLGASEIGRVDYWIQRQTEAATKYGKDDHEATVAMLNELGIPQNICQRIYGMGYWDIKNVMTSSDWHLKVALYSDLRVGPLGIVSLRERLTDIHSRLAKYKERPELIPMAEKIETQIQAHMDVSVDTINDEHVETNHDLLGYEVTTV